MTPLRIIPLTPALAELVCEFSGGIDLIVGVTEYTDFPPALSNKEKIGGYHHLNYERIFSLKPDVLLVAEGGNAPFEVEILKRRHLKNILLLSENSFSDLIKNVETLGERLGRRVEAKKLKSNWITKREAIISRSKNRPQKSVLIIVDENPLIVAGGLTYFTEVLGWTGAKNLFSDLQVKYPRISKEELLKRNPEVIITFGKKLTPSFLALFSQVKAVKNQQILTIDSDAIQRPGPRMLEAAEIFEKALYSTP